MCRNEVEIVVAALAVTLAHGPLLGQARPSTEVPLEVLTAEIVRFPKTIRIGVGDRAIAYEEALVLGVEVSRAALDSLPPNMEPFLYIGRREYHIFEMKPGRRPGRVRLTFHILNWTALEDGAPVVLTIDHGAPARTPGRFLRQDVPRFGTKLIRDTRR